MLAQEAEDWSHIDQRALGLADGLPLDPPIRAGQTRRQVGPLARCVPDLTVSRPGDDLSMRRLPESDKTIGGAHHHGIEPTPHDDVVKDNDEVARKHSVDAWRRKEGSKCRLRRLPTLDNRARLLTATHDERDTRYKIRRDRHG